MDFRFLNYIRRYSNPLRYWQANISGQRDFTPFDTPISNILQTIVSNNVAFLFKSSLNKKKEYYRHFHQHS
jgi:histidinol phosphatase-like PHP family hydrolase